VRGDRPQSSRISSFTRARPLSVKRPRTVDQDRRRRFDHPLGCDAAAPRLQARNAAERRRAWRCVVLMVGNFSKPIDNQGEEAPPNRLMSQN
jgi:hypothetical protein